MAHDLSEIELIGYRMNLRDQIDQRFESDYDRVLREYNEQHKCCPKCGHDRCLRTLVCMHVDLEHPELTKDPNKAECMECGDIHIVHDRVPKKVDGVYMIHDPKTKN